MASPTVNGQPSTPPASDPAAGAQPQPANLPPVSDMPLTSLNDTGESKRPRDARLIHIVLSNLGIHSYQERVPLQLLDFAYRYTSSVLSDSLRLSAEGYQGNERNAGGRRGGGSGDDGSITVTALRQAIASRMGYHFQTGALPKEFMLEMASERNRMALPKVERGYGVQLPPEKHCLTGVGWSLKDEWESEEEEEEEEEEEDDDDETAPEQANGAVGATREEAMVDVEEEDNDDEEGAGRMEDVFGEDDQAGRGDTAMEED